MTTRFATDRLRSAFLLTMVWLARAQRGTIDRDTTPKYMAPPLTNAGLAIWSISAFAYLVFTVLLFMTLVQRRYSDSRRPFAALLVAAFFTFARSCIIIAETVMTHMSFYEPPRRLLSSLDNINLYLQLWTPPLVFLCMVYILHDRHTAIFGARDGGGDKKLPAQPVGPNELPHRKLFYVTHLFLFFSMVGLGTIAAVLQVRIRRDLLNGGIRTISQLNKRTNVYSGLYYAFRAVWACTIFNIMALAVVVRRTVQRVHPFDTVSQRMLHLATPFYACYVLQNIAFLITFSPVGIKPFNRKLEDKLSFASVFISNFFFIAVMAVLVWVARSGELSEPPPPGAITGMNGSQMGLTLQEQTQQGQQYQQYPLIQQYQPPSQQTPPFQMFQQVQRLQTYPDPSSSQSYQPNQPYQTQQTHAI